VGIELGNNPDDANVIINEKPSEQFLGLIVMSH
jgi:hypothetical protein